MQSKTRTTALMVLNVLFFIAAVVANALAVILPLNGKTTQALSDAYPNLFVPAGLTFSIWGVIYILLSLFCLYQTGAFSKKGEFNSRTVSAVSIWFILSSVANFSWIFAWHYQVVWLSMALMLILLASLIAIHVKLAQIRDISAQETWFVQIPFSVYFGWISVATIANFTALFVRYGWNGFGLPAEAWSIIVIGFALILTTMMLVFKKDIAYSLVVLWALFGILMRSDIAAGQYPAIRIMVIASMSVIGAGIIYASVRLGLRHKKRIV